jgi:hypothetical protein
MPKSRMRSSALLAQTEHTRLSRRCSNGCSSLTARDTALLRVARGAATVSFALGSTALGTSVFLLFSDASDHEDIELSPWISGTFAGVQGRF